MEIGWFTFTDLPVGDPGAAARRIPELLEEIALADQVGLDIFGMGEHHHPGFGGPAPAVVLAAATARTEHIRLTSAVTVLGADDPVRVFEQFSSLDLVSGGRAEIMAGRGALLDPFRIFGPDLADYDAAFEEKLRLLLDLRRGEPVTWSGRFRPALQHELIGPRPVQETLPVWLAVGGTPASAVRAAELGLSLALGTVGGHTSQYEPLVELYRRALDHYDRPELPVAVTLHGFVADTSQKARDIYYPADALLYNTAGASRGIAGVTAADIAAKNFSGSMYAVGSPQQVIDQLLLHHEHSATSARCSSWPSATSSTVTSCAPSSCSAPRWPPSYVQRSSVDPPKGAHVTYPHEHGDEDGPLSRTPSGSIRTLGIFGAGESGVAIARVALAAGYQVRIATSGPADRTALLMSVVTPGAVAVAAEEVPAQSDAIVLAVPLRRWRELPLALLADRVVIDVMNYWLPVDGVLPEFETDRRPTSEVVSAALPTTARLVKTLNHIGYHEIEELAHRSGSADRTALAIAGDDDRAVAAVTHLIDDIGFDPVLLGHLSRSGVLQPGSPVFGANLDRHRLRSALTTTAIDPPTAQGAWRCADGACPGAVWRSCLCRV